MQTPSPSALSVGQRCPNSCPNLREKKSTLISRKELRLASIIGLGTALRIAQRRPLVFAKVNLALSLLPVVATPQFSAREAFFLGDLPDEKLLVYWKQMQDEFMWPFWIWSLDLTKPMKVKTPMLVLGAAGQHAQSRRNQGNCTAYNTQAVIIPDVAHNSMLEERWQSVAERILEWLNEREVVNTSVSSEVDSGVVLRQTGDFT